jgi:hypothetical protein
VVEVPMVAAIYDDLRERYEYLAQDEEIWKKPRG